MVANLMDNNEFRTGVISPVECVKEGWELIKSDYWILFAVTIVGALIGGFSMYILMGAMFCGIYYCYLQKIDGKPVSFDGLWKGFEWFVPGLVVTIFIVGPIILLYIVIYVPIVMALILGSQLGEAGMMGLLIAAVVVDLIFIVIMICFHTLLMFSFPLIVDRNLSAIQAMKTSARAVWKNMGGVVGLIGVNFGLVIVGYLALCIGIYFVIPIMMAGNVVAYRKVFPSLGPISFNPPPPNAYQGLS